MSQKKVTEATVDAWLEDEDADSSVIEAIQENVEKKERREKEAKELKKKLQQSERLNEELKARVHQLELEVERLRYTQEENARLNEQIDKLTADNEQSLNGQVGKILEELPLLRSSFSSGLLGIKDEISSLKSAQQSHSSALSRGFDGVNIVLNNIALKSVSEDERFLFEDSLSSPATVTGKKRASSSKGKEPKSKKRKTRAGKASEDSEAPSEGDDSNRQDDADDNQDEQTEQAESDEQEVIVRKKKKPAKRGRPRKSTKPEQKQQEEETDNSQAETDNEEEEEEQEEEEEEEQEGETSRTTRSRSRQSLKNEAERKNKGSQKSAAVKGLKVGDCVAVRAAKGPDYIGVVTDLKEIKKGEPTVVEVTWFYRNKDVIKRGKELGLNLNTTLSNDDRELYLSNHADDNKVSAIVKRVQVIRVNKRQDNASERKLWLSLDPDHYYYTRKYNSKTHTFFPLD